MVQASGTARIRHAETGEVFEVDSDLLDFDIAQAEERGMGPETTYVAVVDHPELGQLVWSVWEYPVGAINDFATDVGPHTLLRNVELSITNDRYGGPGAFEINMVQERTAAEDIVDWFFERYEDPVHRLPYISAEGGYQWIYGGPYDAREVLGENFPDTDEGVIEAAVEEIESDGLTEWAPVASADDYIDDIDYGEPRSPDTGAALAEIVVDLNAMVPKIPEPNAHPMFRIGGDFLFHLVPAPDAAPKASDDALHDELLTAARALLVALGGTNAHQDLLDATKSYVEALASKELSISRVYARGIRLENTEYATVDRIAADDLPAFSVGVESMVRTVLELHRTYIMSRTDGRELANGAAAFRRRPEETSAIKDAAELFGEDVREEIAAVVNDIGTGPQPERSNQVAIYTLGNLISGLVKGVTTNQGVILSAIVGGAFVASVPGAAAVAGGATIINAVWTFLAANAQPLMALAVSAGVIALPWLLPLSQALDRLRRLAGMNRD